MADRDSASESDSSSIDGGPIMMPPSPVTREQLQKRIESLQQHNRVLKVELETYKLRVKALQEENRSLRQASVIIVSLLRTICRRLVFYIRLVDVSLLCASISLFLILRLFARRLPAFFLAREPSRAVSAILRRGSRGRFLAVGCGRQSQGRAV